MNQKQLINGTLVGLASIIPLGAIATGIAIAQASIDTNALRSTA